MSLIVYFKFIFFVCPVSTMNTHTHLAAFDDDLVEAHMFCASKSRERTLQKNEKYTINCVHSGRRRRAHESYFSSSLLILLCDSNQNYTEKLGYTPHATVRRVVFLVPVRQQRPEYDWFLIFIHTPRGVLCSKFLFLVFWAYQGVMETGLD